jgi:hypothetical protein
VASELAKVALTSITEGTTVAEYYMICAGTTARAIDPALRQQPRTKLIATRPRCQRPARSGALAVVAELVAELVAAPLDLDALPAAVVACCSVSPRASRLTATALRSPLASERRLQLGRSSAEWEHAAGDDPLSEWVAGSSTRWRSACATAAAVVVTSPSAVPPRGTPARPGTSLAVAGVRAFSCTETPIKGVDEEHEEHEEHEHERVAVVAKLAALDVGRGGHVAQEHDTRRTMPARGGERLAVVRCSPSGTKRPAPSSRWSPIVAAVAVTSPSGRPW